MITQLLSLNQPDSSVEPFFNSLVRQLGIPDVFSLQMCGAGLAASSVVDPAGGSLVSGRGGGGGQMNISAVCPFHSLFPSGGGVG